MQDLIINFTPTGMIPTKEMTPMVPITPAEIIEQVIEAVETGITMVHLHARDEQTGIPTSDPITYEKIITGIRKYAPELIVCVSLSGRNIKEFKKRSAVLQLEGNAKPDMGSLTLSSLNFNKQASVNSPEMIKLLAGTMKEKNILPELEAFDVGMINFSKYLMKKALLRPPFYYNFILGNIACAQPNLLHMGMMINDLPTKSYWSIGGIGNFQLPMNAMAIAGGGGVRVGLEDNIWFDKERTKLASNIDLIKRIHRLAEAYERSIMKPGPARKLLNLNPGNGEYGTKPE